MAVDARCIPGDVAVLLAEETSRLSGDWYAVGGSDEYVHERPSADPGVDAHDVLGQVIAGSFGGGQIRFHDLELRHPVTSGGRYFGRCATPGLESSVRG